MPPTWENPTIPLDERFPDNWSEYRPTMIAAVAMGVAPVLRKSPPKRCFGTCFEGVGAYPHDARAFSGIGENFACLTKEIDAPWRPPHAPVALRQPARPAEFALQSSQHFVKLLQVICALAAQCFALHRGGEVTVIPAKVSIWLRFWIPAFAGMTVVGTVWGVSAWGRSWPAP